MKRHLRSVAFALTASLLSICGESVANIQTYETNGRQDCCSEVVFLSSPCYTYDFEFRTLFLKPSGSNLDYAAEAFPTPVPSPHWKIFEIRPDYSFGFDIGASLVCHERNSDLSFNYEHFDSKDSSSRTVPLSNMIGPFFEIGPDAAPYTKAHGHVTFLFDSADLNYGTFINFGSCLETNLYIGVKAARIKQTLGQRFSSPDGRTVRQIRTPSNFAGAGPEIGFDFSYSFFNCFKLNGQAEAGLIVGSHRTHTDYTALTPTLPLFGITPPNKQSTHVQHRTLVVPTFSGRLGLAYSYALCDGMLFNIEAGYEAKVYINAIQSVDMGSEVVTPPILPDTVGVFARTFHRTISNFALSGPYLAFNLEF
jgi:hypothetical protein